jgi:hypothetical protein
MLLRECSVVAGRKQQQANPRQKCRDISEDAEKDGYRSASNISCG